MTREKAAKIAKDIQKDWQLLNAIEVIEGLFPLAVCHAAVYQVTNELPDLHPDHAEIIKNAKTLLTKLKGGE